MSGSYDDEDDDDFPVYEDDCDHLEADVDLMTGNATCRCGHHWYLSGDEIRREAQLQADMMAAYYEQCEDEDPHAD